MKRIVYLCLLIVSLCVYCTNDVLALDSSYQDNVKIAKLIDDDTGKEYPIYENSADVVKKEDGIYEVEKIIDIYIPENEKEKIKIRGYKNTGISVMSSQTNDDYDDSLSWQAKITCQYTKKKVGGSNQLLLTKVSGKFIRHDSSVRISGRSVTYACKSYGESAKQRNTKKPTGNSFSYSTGYKKYVPDSKASCVGANCGAYLQRGTSGKKWYFDVAANICLATAP